MLRLGGKIQLYILYFKLQYGTSNLHPYCIYLALKSPLIVINHKCTIIRAQILMIKISLKYVFNNVKIYNYMSENLLNLHLFFYQYMQKKG